MLSLVNVAFLQRAGMRIFGLWKSCDGTRVGRIAERGMMQG
jgi:hypothetical protein